MIELDGTPGKARLGANAVLAVSLAVARAAASEQGLPLYRHLGGGSARTLPVPMMNIVNGGAHASNNVDIQEFMVMPVGAGTFTEGLRMGVEVFHALKKVLDRSGQKHRGGGRGGIRPRPGLRYRKRCRGGDAGHRDGRLSSRRGHRALRRCRRFRILCRMARYTFHKSSGASLSSGEMIAFWEEMIARFPLVSLEDPLDEDDWAGWADAHIGRVGDRCQIVGDDLFATNLARLQRGMRERARPTRSS